MFTIFGLVLVIGIVRIVLCRQAKKKPKRAKLSFDRRVYVNLEEKVKERFKQLKAKISDVQKNGYKPKSKEEEKAGEDKFVINEVVDVAEKNNS